MVVLIGQYNCSLRRAAESAEGAEAKNEEGAAAVSYFLKTKVKLVIISVLNFSVKSGVNPERRFIYFITHTMSYEYALRLYHCM